MHKIISSILSNWNSISLDLNFCAENRVQRTRYVVHGPQQNFPQCTCFNVKKIISSNSSNWNSISLDLNCYAANRAQKKRYVVGYMDRNKHTDKLQWKYNPSTSSNLSSRPLGHRDQIFPRSGRSVHDGPEVLDAILCEILSLQI